MCYINSRFTYLLTYFTRTRKRRTRPVYTHARPVPAGTGRVGYTVYLGMWVDRTPLILIFCSEQICVMDPFEGSVPVREMSTFFLPANIAYISIHTH